MFGIFVLFFGLKIGIWVFLIVSILFFIEYVMRWFGLLFVFILVLGVIFMLVVFIVCFKLFCGSLGRKFDM